MTRTPADAAPPSPGDEALAERERVVLEALRDLEFGTVEIAIHNARIVQITRSQKIRFDER